MHDVLHNPSISVNRVNDVTTMSQIPQERQLVSIANLFSNGRFAKIYIH